MNQFYTWFTVRPTDFVSYSKSAMSFWVYNHGSVFTWFNVRSTDFAVYFIKFRHVALGVPIIMNQFILDLTFRPLENLVCLLVNARQYFCIVCLYVRPSYFVVYSRSGMSFWVYNHGSVLYLIYCPTIRLHNL